MISAIFMICILLLSVMFIMHFNGQNKDIYMFIYLFIYCFRDWEGKIDKWAYGPWLWKVVGLFVKV